MKTTSHFGQIFESKILIDTETDEILQVHLHIRYKYVRIVEMKKIDLEHHNF